MLRVACASANPHKVAEIFDLMGGIIELQPRPEGLADVVEDADTLVGNARLKAIAVCAATGMPALADDTGLEVDALDGAPGVRTARFASEHATDADNRQKMLQEVSGKERTCRFRTVALLRFPDGKELIAEGVCEGTLSLEEIGERGFGYDPLFVVPGEGMTSAELPRERKAQLSHRGRALQQLKARWGETGL